MPPATLVIPLEVAPDLRLEPVQPAHAAPLFALVDGDRERLGARLPWVEGTRSPEDTGAFIEAMRRQQDVAGGGDGGGAWVMTAGHEGVVGVVGTHEIHWPHRRASIGYWIAGAFEGRGLVTRSVSRVTDHLLGNGMHRVEIRAMVDNERSRAVADRCGYQLEGTHRAVEWMHGRPIDLAVYGRLRGDA